MFWKKSDDNKITKNYPACKELKIIILWYFSISQYPITKDSHKPAQSQQIFSSLHIHKGWKLKFISFPTHITCDKKSFHSNNNLIKGNSLRFFKWASMPQNRDENSQPFSIRKICRWTQKWRKSIFKSLFKGLKKQNINRNQSVYAYFISKKWVLTSFKHKFQLKQLTLYKWERSGSVVECLTRDRGAAGSSRTGDTTLWSLRKTHLS